MNRQPIAEVAETLLECFESNTTFQTDRMMTVPAASYIDPAQWRAERELIFKRLPLMLALSCELPKPGDYKAMEVVGLPILITRDKAGTVHAFLNVCAHRWAPLAPQGRGNCPNFRFVCPFHGWTYGADGKLLAVADRAKFGDVDKSTRGLRELPCEERHGMIFVCLTPGSALDLDSYYGALLQEFQQFGLRDWYFIGSRVLEAPNWKLICTNFFESYHFATQHPKTVSLRWVSNLCHYESFGPNMRIGFAEHAIAQLRDVPRAQWGQQEGRAFTFMRYFFPNVVCSLYLSEISLIAQFFPGSTPDRTRVVTLYVREKSPKDAAERAEVDSHLQSVIEVGEATLRDEDFATGIATQKGLESGAHEGMLYGRNERGPQYFHEWVNWYLQDNPRLPKPVL